MRELRDEFMLEEAYAWASSGKDYVGNHAMIGIRLHDLSTGKSRIDYPESFYKHKQSPLGSYGYAVRKLCGFGEERVYGELIRRGTDGFYYLHCIGDRQFDTFTPGLPDGVDENGLPKETP